MRVTTASGTCGSKALTLMAWVLLVADTEHWTDAPGICTASAALIALWSCAAKPETVCGSGVVFENTLIVIGSGEGGVAGEDTKS